MKCFILILYCLSPILLIAQKFPFPVPTENHIYFLECYNKFRNIYSSGKISDDFYLRLDSCVKLYCNNNMIQVCPVQRDISTYVKYLHKDVHYRYVNAFKLFKLLFQNSFESKYLIDKDTFLRYYHSAFYDIESFSSYSIETISDSDKIEKKVIDVTMFRFKLIDEKYIKFFGD